MNKNLLNIKQDFDKKKISNYLIVHKIYKLFVYILRGNYYKAIGKINIFHYFILINNFQEVKYYNLML